MRKPFLWGIALLLSLSLAFAVQQEEVKDPVCGMKIKVAEAKFKTEFKGKTYYFCSADCKGKFDKEPTKYVKEEKEQKHNLLCCALSEEIMKDVKVEKKETEKGVTVTMTSENPEVAKKLQEAVGKCKMMGEKMEHMEHKEMKHEECCMMHTKGVKSKVTNIKNGVQIELTSDNPDIVKKIKTTCENSSCCGKKEHKH